MKAILDLFQGKAPLVGAPTETTPAVGETAAADPNATPPATASAQPEGVTQTTAAPITVVAPPDTTPAGPVPTDNDQGVVPDRNATC
jgi:hypothetical protein